MSRARRRAVTPAGVQVAMLDGRTRSRAAARRRAARRRMRLLRTSTVLAGLVALLVWLAGSGGGLASPSPAEATVRVTLPHVAIPAAAAAGSASAAPALPWPKTGQAAVDIPAVGFQAQSGAELPVPVASMTKVMTAYVVLADHPLALGEQGPKVRITPADASQFGMDTVTDQANVLLKAGEKLSEYQMLEGLLVRSANDLAYTLASWDAGSVAAFVAKMNAAARSLGMRDTHFADASGFSPLSVSTASDLLRAASAAMADPVFASIVSQPAVSLPLAGTVGSYTPLLGGTGVVGVKSGFTNAAGGGDILAFRATVGGQSFLSLAAVTSQQGWTVLGFSAKEALALAKAASSRVQAVTMAGKGRVVARLSAGSRSVRARTAAAARILAIPGDPVRQSVHVTAPAPDAKRGTVVGSATFALAAQRVTVPVRLAARLP